MPSVSLALRCSVAFIFEDNWPKEAFLALRHFSVALC